MRHWKRPLPSGLLDRTWEVPHVGRVTLTFASHPIVTRVDAEWPAQRRFTECRNWRWTELVSGCIERFALVDESGGPLFLWCTAARKPLRLCGGPFYRPAFLEANPALHGAHVGTFGMAVIAARAAELGCRGIVLKATPSAAPFYQRLGGIPGPVPGWYEVGGLVTFTLADSAFRRLKEVSDGLSVER